jgi:hypothetical protein
MKALSSTAARFTMAALLLVAGGCNRVPPPPETPAGVVLPPEVELSAEEAQAQQNAATPQPY